MTVKFLGKTSVTGLIHGKMYEVLSVERDWYRIIDEEGIDENEELQGYLYPPGAFEIVSEDE